MTSAVESVKNDRGKCVIRETSSVLRLISKSMSTFSYRNSSLEVKALEQLIDIN